MQNIMVLVKQYLKHVHSAFKKTTLLWKNTEMQKITDDNVSHELDLN